MYLLQFHLSAEAHHIANRRCECLRGTYKTILDFVTHLYCQANGPWENWVRCLSAPSNFPLHNWDPLQGRSGFGLPNDLLRGLIMVSNFQGFFSLSKIIFACSISDLSTSFFFLPAGYKVVWLLQCVCIQGLSSLDCFYMFIMKVTTP